MRGVGPVNSEIGTWLELFVVSEERSRRSKAQDSVCQGLSLVPIHRDTRTDLKIEKGGVSRDTRKKEENRKPRNK